MEIVPGIHSIPVGEIPSQGLAPPNVFLVVGEDGAAFIDSGYRRDDEIRARLEYLASLDSPPVRAIVLTHRHPDHMGGAAHFHRATRGEILSSSIEKSTIDSSLERMGDSARVHHTVADGETLALGGLTLEFVHAPGHTLGSMAIYAQEPRALLTGDSVLGWGSVVIRPEDGDMALYMQTLHRFLQYDLDLICPGHGPMVEEPHAKVREYIQHRQQREADVMATLKDGLCTLDQMFPRLYPKILPRLAPLGRSQIQSHLIKLEQEGRVCRVTEEEYRVAD